MARSPPRTSEAIGPVAGPVADRFGLHETMVAAAVLTAALFVLAAATHAVRAVTQESMAS